MRRIAPLVAMLAFAGCQRTGQGDGSPANPGAALEQAAVTAGLVSDPASRSIVGSWARDTDRACIVPPASGSGDSRIGVLIDYGTGQGCAGTGTVRRHGDELDVRLGTCRVTARYDGSRIIFPPEVPSTCDRLCTGRASIAAMALERQSESASEAASLRAPSGKGLCSD